MTRYRRHAQRTPGQSGRKRDSATQFWPEGVHVSLLIVDGAIGEAGASDGKRLDHRAIGAAALSLTQQSSPAWSFEVDLRPKDEPW